MCITVESSTLANGNFRELFSLAGKFCVFQKGIPGGPSPDLYNLPYRAATEPRPCD